MAAKDLSNAVEIPMTTARAIVYELERMDDDTMFEANIQKLAEFISLFLQEMEVQPYQ